MAKKKSSNNNEMNAILDQLKKSYAVDSLDSDNSIDSDASYQDSELASLLTRIIADNSSEFMPEEDEDTQPAEQDATVDPAVLVEEEEITEPVITQDIESILEDDEDETIFAHLVDDENEDDTTFADLEEGDEDDTTFADLEDECDEDDTTFADLEDEENEDDTTFADLEEDDEDETTFADLEDEENEDDTTFADLEDECDEDDTTFADLEDECDEDDTTFADLEDEENEDDTTFADLEDEENEDVLDDISVANDGEIASRPEDEESDIEIPLHPDPETETETESEEEEYVSPYVEAAADDNDIEDEVTEHDVQPVKEHFVTSVEEYTYDPLQWSIGVPESSFDGDIPEDIAFEGHTKIKNMRDDDISLLLSLGYGDELNREIGSDRTQSVADNMASSYRPEKCRIPYGFCGSEFTEKQQIEGIKQKYAFDKRMLIIKLASLSVIAVILAILGVMAKLHTGTSSPVMFPIIELIIMTLGCVIISKELWRGFKSIFKFQSTSFAVSLLALVLFYAYDIFTVIAYFVDKGGVIADGMPMFGFTAAMFSIFALVGEVLSCTREQAAFNLICSSQELYAAELITGKANAPELRSPEIRRTSKGSAVRVRRTSYISSYFKKSSEPYSGTAGTFLLAGIVSVAVIAAACISLFLKKSAHEIATAIIFSAFMSMFASALISAAVIMFTASRRLREDGCDVIGRDVIRNYADVDTVIFKDSAVIEISDDIDVIPGLNVDVQKNMKLASRLFSALGGPISRVLGQNALDKDKSVSAASINISHVKDNGIDLYMDNVTHVVLGDEAFIRSYGIRLNPAKNQLISSAKANGKCVLYLAIDDVLVFGYVLAPAVRDSVIDNINKLYRNKINTFICTYEPEISDSRFMGTHKVKVYKPNSFEDNSRVSAVDGSAVASSDATNIAQPLLMCRRMVSLDKKVGKLLLLFAAAGTLLSVIALLLGYLADMLFLLRYRDVFTVGTQLVAIIPIFAGRIKKGKNVPPDVSEETEDNKEDKNK